MNKQQRLLEIGLVFTALSCFLTAMYFTFTKGYHAELIWLFFLYPFLFLAYFVKPRFIFRSTQQKIILASVSLLFFWKHINYPCLAKIYTVVDISIVFHFGSACLLLGTLELYQKRIQESITFLVLYSYLTLVTSSYTLVTNYFLLFLTIYVLFLFFLNRFLLYQKLPRQSAFPRKIWRWSFLSCLLLCLLAGKLLHIYREELNAWQPLNLFDDGKKKYQGGFSPISVLGSKEISVSRDPVLRYFAPRGKYYLRGKVFDTYSHGRWQLSLEKMTALQTTQLPEKNHQLFYTTPRFRPESLKSGNWTKIIFLQNRQPFIFAPLSYILVKGNQEKTIYRNKEGVLRSPAIFDKVTFFIYQVKSLQTRTFRISPFDYRRYTRVPKEEKDYFYQFARQIAGEEKKPRAIVAKIRQYLRMNHRYAREIKLDPKTDPIRNFLEKNKSGHCEMFASSFVMLARSLGVPARYVTGYYAHEWNSWGNFVTVRSCDAHAWAEVFFSEQGWIKIEPTAPASLNQLLQDYRGTGEKLREAVSEYFRVFFSSFWNHLFVYIFVGTICFLLIIKQILFLQKKSTPKKTKKQIPSSSPQISTEVITLRSILNQIENSIEQHYRKKHSYETLREYYQQAKPKLPSKFSALPQTILHQSENILYNENPTKEDLQTLENKWKQVQEE